MKNQPTQSNIPYHIHNGPESPQILLQNIKGWDFRTVTLATTMPADTPPNGAIRFLSDGTNDVMWVRMNNNWKKTTLS